MDLRESAVDCRLAGNVALIGTSRFAELSSQLRSEPIAAREQRNRVSGLMESAGVGGTQSGPDSDNSAHG